MESDQKPSIVNRFWWVFVVVAAAVVAAFFLIMDNDGVNANQERNQQEQANQ